MGGGGVRSAEQVEAGQFRSRDGGVDRGDHDIGATRAAPARLVEHGRGRARAIRVTEIDSDVGISPAHAFLQAKQVLWSAAPQLTVGRRPRVLRGDDVQIDVRERIDHLVGQRLAPPRPEAAPVGLTHEKVADVCQLGGFDDPLRDIGSAQRNEGATELGREPLIALHVDVPRGAHRYHHAEPAEAARDPDGTTDQGLGAGGTLDRHQHVLGRRLDGSRGSHRLGHQPQGDFPESGEIARSEEVRQRRFHLVRLVDVAVLHPLTERLR